MFQLEDFEFGHASVTDGLDILVPQISKVQKSSNRIQILSINIVDVLKVNYSDDILTTSYQTQITFQECQIINCHLALKALRLYSLL